MPRGSFCSQLCYYLSFSWCWHRESRQEGVEPNQSKESLLLNLDDERHWSSNKNIGTKINDHYRFSDNLLSIGENNLPILTQADEFESIVLDPPQLPEESDKKFKV